MAVSTDSGLITPIVFGANSKGLGEISRNVKDLAGKAKSGSLKPEEFIVIKYFFILREELLRFLI